MNQLRVFSNLTLDLDRWDTAIREAKNSRIYALSSYLNLFNDYWEAFILGDYDYVMPIPIRRRFGLKFVVQPNFCQQLGIFSHNDIPQDILAQFLKKLYRSYFYIHYSFNSENRFECHQHLFSSTNHLLLLTLPHATLYKNYSRRHRRNIAFAQEEGLSIVEKTSTISFESLLKQMLLDKEITGTSTSEIKALCAFFEIVPREQLTILSAIHLQSNEEVCLGVFVHYQNREVFFIGRNKRGKELRASYLVVDYLIKKFAGTSRIVDFTGSNLPSVAEFNLGFRAEAEIYYKVKPNFITRLIDFINRMATVKLVSNA